MAKMKVLKPTLDAIKAKYGEDMQKIQMEQMRLYREMGINPLSGCIPVLLQMPILLALFNFFPMPLPCASKPFYGPVICLPMIQSFSCPLAYLLMVIMRACLHC